MDLQAFVDNIKPPTCVISVEKKPDGSCGEIRIVTGNPAYIKSVEDNPDFQTMKVQKFEKNMPYEHYLTKDLNFEEVCFRCAVLKKSVHYYVRPERYNFWLNEFMIPLDVDNGNIYYCTFTLETDRTADPSQMADIPIKTANDVIKICIKLRDSTDYDNTMDRVMEDIRLLCRAQFCTLLLVDNEKKSCHLQSLASTPDILVPPTETWITPDFYQIAESWKKMIDGSNCLILKNEKDMEFIKDKNPAWFASLKEAHVQNIALFPLVFMNETLGYIWATNFDIDDIPGIKRTLELTTYFISSEISTHQFSERLRILSSTDMLTGLFNRNEMNNRIYRLGLGEPVGRMGVAFVDLNGLKRTNDTEGHLAGDMLLKRAAEILKEVCDDGEVYRAGGDEFMILYEYATEEIMNGIVEKLKNADPTVSFSVGWTLEEDGTKISNALHIADERMYADKEKYYQEHPEFRR